METRRLLIAALLSMAVVFLWQWVVMPPPEPPVSESAPSPVSTETATPPAEREPAPSDRPPPSPTPSTAEATLSEATDVEAPPREANREERIRLESGTAVAEISNRGGQLLSYRLEDHFYTLEEKRPVDMVRERADGQYPFALLGPDGQALATEEALLEVQRDADGRGVTLAYRGPLGAVEKRFRFDEKGLLRFEAQVPGESGWSVLLGPGVRDRTGAEEESRFAINGAVYRLGGEVEREKSAKASEAVILPAAGLGWVGLEDTYFATVVTPQSGLSQVVIEPVVVEGAGEVPGEHRFVPFAEAGEAAADLPRVLRLRLTAAGDSLSLISYWGAKDYDRLAALPGRQEGVINLGFFAPLSRPLMIGLRWIHDHVVANYGWAIVLMTVLINIVLLPLTHKSTVSMRKMQQLNPKMQAIRSRYAGKLKDKQGRPNMEAQRKMNEEIMALYKAEGVNPAGGCLPMLLQLPVFFAFYKLLYNWVALRHAPWILWVHDLSAPFPALAIIMGGTQFLQQRMMPATGNPMQRRIMMLMPVFFTFLFLGFPSGLVLYWLTNNVLGIARQGIYNRLLPSGDHGAAAVKKGAEKGKESRDEKK